jgi:ABC-type uncharacterized transport system YnjBCD ATPase subunit
MTELVIDDLQASVAGKQILHGVTITVRSGEVHAVMGPNGSGKSTLSNVLMGRPGYEVTGGTVALDGVDLLSMPTWQRAQAGLFLAQQYPTEVPGVAVREVLSEALVAAGRSTTELESLVADEAERIGLSTALLDRAMNVDLSGGETSLGRMEAEVDGAVGVRLKVSGDGLVPVTHPGKDGLLAVERLINPSEVGGTGRFGVEPLRVRRIEGHVQGLRREILFYHDEIFLVGIGRQADAFTLSDGIAVQATVLADFLADGVDDGTRCVGDVAFEEVLHRHLPEEANALAILARGVRELGLDGQAADFWLGKFANREEGLGELVLAQQGEEV